MLVNVADNMLGVLHIKPGEHSGNDAVVAHWNTQVMPLFKDELAKHELFEELGDSLDKREKEEHEAYENALP